MRALVCTNSQHDVVSIHISTNPSTLNELMRRRYEDELASLEDEGYDLTKVIHEFNYACDARIFVDYDYSYNWQIISCTEV